MLSSRGSLNYESRAASLFATLRGRAQRARVAVRACSYDTGECKNVNQEAEMHPSPIHLITFDLKLSVLSLETEFISS